MPFRTLRPTPRAFRLAMLAGAVAVVAAPDAARACACCDGYSHRTIVGWSASGTAALVDVERNAACETTRFLEVWEVGKRNPAACYDLFADPNKRIRCDDVAAPEDYKAKPAKSRAVGQYPGPVTVLEARYLKGTLAPAKVARAGDPSVASLVVEVLGAGSWHTVLRRKVNLEYEAPSGENAAVAYPPLSLLVYPTPDRRHALVSVDGNDSSPGIGHLATELHLVDLPEKLGPLGGQGTAAQMVPAKGAVRARAIPAITTKKTERYREAVRQNAKAMALHRGGSYQQAAAGFIDALVLDPSHVLARYNLACAFTRLGQPEKAMSLLREIHDAKCPTCAEVLGRAATDEDLIPLRAQEDFRRLGQ